VRFREPDCERKLNLINVYFFGLRLNMRLCVGGLGGAAPAAMQPIDLRGGSGGSACLIATAR